MNKSIGIDGFSKPVGEVLQTNLRVNSVSRNLFSIMRQSTATNKLATLKSSDNALYEKESDIAKIERENLKVVFENFSSLGKGLKTTTHRLLDALIIKFTETGSKEPVVYLSLDEYMDYCILKNEREIRKQVKEDLNTLLNIRVTFEKSSNHEQSLCDTKICDDARIKNGMIIFTFSEAFFRVLKVMPVMPYPMKLFELNNKKNPNSYYFLKKIAEHKKMNYFKKNADILSVRTLLECTPELPKYDDVINGDRAVTRRIIEPFERDLNELSDIISWEYCHTNGRVMTDDELNNFNYYVFFNLLIKVSWNEYPVMERKTIKTKKSKV